MEGTGELDGRVSNERDKREVRTAAILRSSKSARVLYAVDSISGMLKTEWAVAGLAAVLPYTQRSDNRSSFMCVQYWLAYDIYLGVSYSEGMLQKYGEITGRIGTLK